MTEAFAYFERETHDRFRPTSHVGGAWKTDEQHIAPAMGLLAHVFETDHRERRGDDGLALSRVSYDIFGVLPIEPVDVSVHMVRPGRSIELLEARLEHQGRTALTARAWFASTADTEAMAGSTFPSIPAAEELPIWEMTERWDGGLVDSLELRQRVIETGHAITWIRTDAELVAGEPVSPTAALLGLVDVANGLACRVPPDQVLFPNVDLTAHLFREHHGEWTGFDTTVHFGPTGVGLTHTVLHDDRGPFGTVAQSLTIRPRA
ncbi:thioesterase family protein [Luteococcus sp. Sow4_B9]|uniref:thioesterase family protein n=1 Tax=Luteococcus sp. Sow4_B9 TaxID=3438792 RepID=UPI003F9C5032